MKKTKTIICGKIEIDGKQYDAEIIDDIFILKDEDLSNNLSRHIIGKVVLFIPTAKGGPDYYVFIEKRLTSYYSCTSFNILLLYRNYKDCENLYFEIESKGFTNAINSSFSNEANVLDYIDDNLNKDLFSSSITIENTQFQCSFSNIAKLKRNNLCPADFTSCLKLVPKDGLFVDKIKTVYDFAIKLLQFLTINTYSVIDEIRIINKEGGYSTIEIFEETTDLDIKNDRYLSIKPFSKNIGLMLECFPNSIKRQYNLYHYKREWVFEFDIVRLSGAFEDVFREYVEKSDAYKMVITKRKTEISYDELKKVLKEFSEQHNLGSNADFQFCKKLFEDYGGTLKNKLEFALNDFCSVMDYIIIDTSFFYSPALFETRLKDARNAVCHGLHNKKIDWKNAANDTLILQEIIYFILLKYKMKLPVEQIKESLDISFGNLNKQASFYKKDDPRIKWVD